MDTDTFQTIVVILLVIDTLILVAGVAGWRR